MPEGGQPYPNEIIEGVLASDNPTADEIINALDAGGFVISTKPPAEEPMMDEELPPVEEGGGEMGLPPGVPGEMPPNPGNPGGPPGKSALIIAVRGAMDEDKKRKSKAKSKKEAVA